MTCLIVPAVILVYLPPASGNHACSAQGTFDQAGQETDPLGLDHLFPPVGILPAFFLYLLPFFYCNNRFMRSFSGDPLLRIRLDNTSVSVFPVCPPPVNKLPAINRIVQNT